MRKLSLFVLLAFLPRPSQAQSLVTTSNQVYKGVYRLSSVSGLDSSNCIAYAPSRSTWFAVLNRNNYFDVIEFYMPDMSNYPGTTYGSPPVVFPAGVNSPSSLQSTAPPAITKTDWGTFLSNQQNVKNITAISTGNPTTITTSTAHGYSVGTQVWFNGTDSTPAFTPGTLYTITAVTSTTFNIAVNITGAGTTGTVSNTSPYPVGNGPLDKNQYDSYGCYWDDNAGTNGRLLLSYGNFYSCNSASDDAVLLGMDFTGAVAKDPNHQPVVYGPWIMSYTSAGNRINFNCGEAQTQAQPAVGFITNDTTVGVLNARGCPGSGSGSTRRDACNNSGGTPYNDWSGTKVVQSAGSLLVTGEKQSGTGGNASWGPMLELCDYPAMQAKTAGNFTPASDGSNANTWINCTKMLYWTPNNQDLTDDLGQLHTTIQQAGSPIKRRDPYGLLFGTNATSSLPGRPLDCSSPYGLYNTPILNQVGYTGYNGWAPGTGNSGDLAYHFIWIDEDSSVALHGLAFYGTYAIGYQWYGLGTFASDDFDPSITSTCPADGTLGTLAMTTISGWKSDDGIYADGTSSGFRGQITNISLTSGLTTCGGVSLTNTGNICLTSSCTCVSSLGHGLANGASITFSGTNSTPALSTGTVANRSNDAFTVVTNVTIAGNTGTIPTIQGSYGTPLTAVSSVSLSTVVTCGGISITPGVSCITATGHPFNNGDTVWFNNTNSTPNLNYGLYTVANKSTNAFTIAATITNAGSTGFVSKFTGGTTSARWLQSWAFPAVTNSNGSDVCGVNGGGTRNSTGLTTGYNPCRYIYGRRNGGKGYNSEYTVPAWWVYQPSDILTSLQGNYNNTRLAINSTVEVDHAGFDVFAAPPLLAGTGTCAVDGVSLCPQSPKYTGLQWNDKQDNYNEKTNRSFNFSSAYFRPTGTSTGTVRRTYTLNDSNLGTSAPQLVSVWDLSGTGCTDTTPTGPTIDTTHTTIATNSINLVWSRESSANETGYNVYKCLGSCGPLSNYSPVAQGIPSGTLNQTAGGLAANTQYTFVVSAFNCAPGEGQSTPTSFTTNPDSTPVVPLSSRSLVFGILYGFGSR